MRKNLLLVILLLLGGIAGLSAQCVIDQNNTVQGFTPDSLPCIQTGTPYAQTIQIHLPTSITQPFPVTIDSIMLLSITGMPSGINYAVNPSTHALPGGGNGCIFFSGTTNDALGNYPLVVTARVWIPGIGAIDSDIGAFGYSFSLDVCAPNGSGSVCDTISNLVANDTITYFTFNPASGQTGYLSGNNSYADRAKAEKFGATAGMQLTGASLYFSVAKANPSRNITITAYDAGGAAGAPSMILATQTVSLGTIMNDVTNDVFTYVAFPSQPTLPSDSFFIAVTLPITSGDTLVLWTNTGSSPFGRGWEQWSDNTWNTYESAYGDPIGHVILPILCTAGSPPVANFSADDPLGCAPLTVQFSDLSTNTPTSWSWTFAGGTPSTSTQQNPTVSYNTPGGYNVTLNATNGSGSDSESKAGYVIIYAKPTISLTKTDATCTQGGTVTSSVSGGTGFTYLWSNNATTANLTNVSAGNYSVTVTNSNGCTGTASIIVSSPGGLTVTLTKTDASCTQGGSVTSSVSGGSGFTYIWSNGATTANLTNVAAGTYSVTVTNTSGCTATASANVGAGGGITVNLSKTDASCGLMNGSITANPSGGSNYSYLWSNNATTQSLNAIGAGAYSVTVTAFGGCTATASVTLSTTPAVTVTLNKVDAACAQANGSITSNVSGGSGHTYLWSNNATTANLSGLVAGTYTVTVTASGGCTAAASATITTSSGNLSANATVGTTPGCGQSNGSATVAVTGGTPGYTYVWSTTPTQTAATATNISAGAYTVTITDNAGCTTSATVNVGNVGGPTALIQSQSNVDCHGGNDGSVSLTASGGSAPYNYSTNGSNFQQSPTFNGLSAGSYSFYVRDVNNCISTTGATVTEPTPISISFTKTDVACFGGNTGNATANVTGGTPNYNYNWSNSQSGVIAINLTAGSYSLVVMDNNGCTASSSVTISQPSAALSAQVTVANISCNGGTDGTASVNASGGTTPYSYQWSNGQNGSSVSNLDAGTIGITVTDTKGCTASGSGNVTEPGVITVTTTTEDVSCNGGNDGSITNAVSGGTGPYTFMWSPNIPGSLMSVSAGTYNATVEDANGCTATTSATVNQPSALMLSVSVTDATAATAQDGAVTVTATGGTSGYTYLWSNAVTTAANSNLGTNTYTVVVTDANGCTATESAFVDAPPAPPLGIKEAGFNGSVSLFPNPVQGVLFIDIDLNRLEDVQVEIVNVVGVVMAARTEKQVNTTRIQFDMSGYADGIYFVRMSTSDASVMRKVVVAK